MSLNRRDTVAVTLRISPQIVIAAAAAVTVSVPLLLRFLNKLNEPSQREETKALVRAVAQELVKGSEASTIDDKIYSTMHDGTTLVRNRTAPELAVLQRKDSAVHLVSEIERLPPVAEEKDIHSYTDWLVFLSGNGAKQLKNALFVGHLVTDLDSIAGAIGAADLYGGIPCRASEVNTETQFALEKWQVSLPAKIEDMMEQHSDAGICLVDHQQMSQVNGAIKKDLRRIVGVIDHHALQSETIITEAPIHLDIRPWGSMSTIIAHTYLTMGRSPPPPIAGMLLCAILSDTLNLAGPTTTEFDKMMVAILAEIAKVDDIQYLASEQFKAKSREFLNMSAWQLVNGDQKVFTFLDKEGKSRNVGFAVVETTDHQVIMDRRDEIVPEILHVRNEKRIDGKKDGENNRLDVLFLAIVNIVKFQSYVFLASDAEKSLAIAAFGGVLNDDGDVMDLGKRVSRKKEFIPPITNALKDWTPPPSSPRKLTPSTSNTELVVDPLDPHKRVTRQPSTTSGSP